MNTDLLKERIYKLENEMWRWGTGNPETISYTTMDLMLEDPPIYAADKFIKEPLITADWRLEAKEEYKEEEEFIDTYFKKRFLTQVVTQSLTAISYGFSLQEQTYDFVGGIRIPINFKSVKPRHVKNWDYDEVTGDYAGAYIYSKGTEIKYLPAVKSWQYPYEDEKRFNSLWGRTLLKAAYLPWYNSKVIELAMLRHMESQGSPIITIKYPSDLDQDDNPLYKSDADNVANLIPQQKVFTLPDMSKRDTVEGNFGVEFNTGEVKGDQFLVILKWYDHQKILGMGIPPHVISRADNIGSYSEGIVKLESTLREIEGIGKQLEDGINNNIINLILKLNFGDEAINTVKIRVPSLEQWRQTLLVEIAEKLVNGVEAKNYASEELMLQANKILVNYLGGDPANVTLIGGESAVQQ